MENRAHALVAGLFTLLLGAATLVALYLFGEQREDTRQLLVVTKQNVTGLNPQAQVRYRGIRVGKVTDIQLDDQDVSNILITIEVDTKVPLTKGTYAKLSYQGVTGIAHVLLEDEGGKPGRLQADPEGNVPRIDMRPSLLDHLDDALPVVLAQSQQFLENANKVLNAQNRDNVGKTLANLEAASARMSNSLGQLQKLLSDDNVASFSAASREAGPTLEETRKLVQQLQSLTTRVDGVLGDPGANGVSALVPKVNEMTRELTATSRQLNRVLQMLEDSPQSLVYGGPPARPGPGEPGFVAPARP